jgi:hypothetical protein
MFHRVGTAVRVLAAFAGLAWGATKTARADDAPAPVSPDAERILEDLVRLESRNAEAKRHLEEAQRQYAEIQDSIQAIRRLLTGTRKDVSPGPTPTPAGPLPREVAPYVARNDLPAIQQVPLEVGSPFRWTSLPAPTRTASVERGYRSGNPGAAWGPSPSFAPGREPEEAYLEGLAASKDDHLLDARRDDVDGLSFELLHVPQYAIAEYEEEVEIDGQPYRVRRQAVVQMPDPAARFSFVGSTKWTVGGSSASDDDLKALQRGVYDPNQKGVRNVVNDFVVPLSFANVRGVVDAQWLPPGQNGSSGDFRLASALLTAGGDANGNTTRSAPWRVTLGKHAADFGLHNGASWMSWGFLDMPVINGRLMPKPMYGLGLSGELLLPWHGHGEYDSRVSLGMFSADEAGMSSFLGGDAASHGGFGLVTGRQFSFADLVYCGRWTNGFRLPGASPSFLTAGASIAFGPNSTGNDVDTLIYGGDLRYLWQCAPRPDSAFFVAEIEYMRRDMEIGKHVSGADGLLSDWGLSAQGVYAFPQDSLGVPGSLALGMRFDRAAADGTGVKVGTTKPLTTAEDPARCDRDRLSALVMWYPGPHSGVLSHFGFRLQVSLDDASFLDDDEGTVWFGIEAK